MSLEGKILGHFGYPEDLSRQKPGITFGYAKPDKAFGWLEQMKDFVPYMDRTKKSESHLNTTRTFQWRCWSSKA